MTLGDPTVPDSRTQARPIAFTFCWKFFGNSLCVFVAIGRASAPLGLHLVPESRMSR